MAAYRPVPDSDVEAYREVLDYSFRAEEGPDPGPPGDGETDPEAVVERRGVYDDGRLVTTGAHHRFTLRIRGAWVEATGLGGVATLPEARQRGLVRTLLREALAEYRDWNRPFSVLWPFKHAFYRRFGWGRLWDLGRYEFDPGDLAPVTEHPLAGGEFRRLDPDDYAEMRAVDERYAEGSDFAMRRTEAWYRHRFFFGWDGEPFAYGWERDGELRGYLRYDVQHDDDRVLRVADFGAPDDAAVVNLYRFLHRHQAQADGIELYAPVDDRLFDLVDDPRAVELTVRPGPMIRLVDVRDAIEALPAPDGVETAVTLEVDDGLADWNDETFALEATDGAYSVEPEVGDGPRAALPIETLSRLAVGTTTVERGALAGGLEAEDEAVARLQALFPPRSGFLREFF